MTKILNAKEFISEKLDIQHVSKDRLKQAVDEMVKLYLYQDHGSPTAKNSEIWCGDYVVSEKPLPQYDNDSNSFIGLYHSLEELKKRLADKSSQEDVVFSINLKYDALRFFKEPNISDIFNKRHYLFAINDSGKIIQIKSVRSFNKYSTNKK